MVAIVGLGNMGMAMLRRLAGLGRAPSAWDLDPAKRAAAAAAVRAGTFWVNGYRTIHVSVPFGGFGASGYGRSSGAEVLAELTQSKAVWIETGESPALGFGHRPAGY
jgi:acyl-CoA reductase-like NAD-dependent aldehyde dehydrogenase